MEIRRLKEYEQPPWDLLLLADPSKELVSHYINDGICYVADSEKGETIGVIVLLPIHTGKIEIMNLAVHPLFQGKGIGTSLIKHGIQTAMKDSYKTIEIATGNSSFDQLALYQKSGFRITSIDHDFFLRNYDEPIFENGIQCRDKIILSMVLS